MNKSIITALLAATFAFSTTATAAPVALDGSFSTNLSNKTYDAVFSGKSFLPENYTVNGLTFSFSFLDNGGTFTSKNPVQTHYSASNYTYRNGGFFSDTNYRRDISITNKVETTSEQETAQLSFGDIVLGSGATTAVVDSKSSTANSSKLDKRNNCGWFYCDNYYSDTATKTKTIITDYTGGFTISGVVTDQSIIDQLLNTGDLALSLKIFGNLLLTSSEVKLDYTKVETPVEEPGEVPEPSSVLLAGAGLAAIGFLRRRRNAAQA